MKFPQLYYFNRSIKRLVMASFVFVLLVPISFLMSSLYQNSWSHAQQGMLEKHHLIATALVEPFTLFITSRQESLQTLGDDINASYFTKDNEPLLKANYEVQNKIQQLLANYLHLFDDLVAASYISDNGNSRILSVGGKRYKSNTLPVYSNLTMTTIKDDASKKAGGNYVSAVFKSSFSNEPIVLLRHPVINKMNQRIGVINVEVSLKYIKSMCSKINFGVKGHCATVDQLGHVLAHPNKEWEQQIRDISKISVVKKMMSGKSGMTEFYSPFLKADMVVGFASIPALGWGVMIPQPKSELTSSFDIIRNNTLMWLLAGILIALFIAYLLMNKITKPINYLMKRTKEIDSGYAYLELGPAPVNSPSEIKQLWRSFAKLLSSLQNSNNQVKKLNVSLSRDVKKATTRLQEANNRLNETNNLDYLTNIANRRYFNKHVNGLLKQSSTKSIGLMLIDVDKFKYVNDKYGHEAGDLALQHVSNILSKSIRKSDLVARFGGDEFVVFIDNINDKAIINIAEILRKRVQAHSISWEGQTFNITLSIGVCNYHRRGKSTLTLKELLSKADKQMFASKKGGKNQINLEKNRKLTRKSTLENSAP